MNDIAPPPRTGPGVAGPPAWGNLTQVAPPPGILASGWRRFHPCRTPIEAFRPAWDRKSRAGRPGGRSEPLALQRLAIDAQDPRRLALVAACQLEHAADVPPLHRGQVERLRRLLRRSPQQRAHQLGVDVALGARDRPLAPGPQV